MPLEPQPSQSYFEIFESSFRDKVHELVQLGYQHAITKIKTTVEEPSITSHLAEAMETITQDPHSEVWADIVVQEEKPVKKPGAYGKYKPRVDLAIIKVGIIGKRPHFFFEAKRLRTPGYPASIYAGEEGLQCFTTGLYAKEFPEAAMLGYVQSHSIQHWKEKVQKEIVAEALTLELSSPQQDYSGLDAFPDEWISIHNRSSSVNRQITVYHILLDCI